MQASTPCRCRQHLRASRLLSLRRQWRTRLVRWETRDAFLFLFCIIMYIKSSFPFLIMIYIIIGKLLPCTIYIYHYIHIYSLLCFIPSLCWWNKTQPNQCCVYRVCLYCTTDFLLCFIPSLGWSIIALLIWRVLHSIYRVIIYIMNWIISRSIEFIYSHYIYYIAIYRYSI